MTWRRRANGRTVWRKATTWLKATKLDQHLRSVACDRHIMPQQKNGVKTRHSEDITPAARFSASVVVRWDHYHYGVYQRVTRVTNINSGDNARV